MPERNAKHKSLLRLLGRQTNMTGRGGKKSRMLENTGPHNMYLNPGSWANEYFLMTSGHLRRTSS